jgi:hypothetical protein
MSDHENPSHYNFSVLWLLVKWVSVKWRVGQVACRSSGCRSSDLNPFCSSEDSCNTGFACENKLVRKAGVLIHFQNMSFFYFNKKNSKIFYTCLLRLNPSFKNESFLLYLFCNFCIKLHDFDFRFWSKFHFACLSIMK